MKKSYHLILSTISICLLLGCENESFKETVVSAPKITSDLHLNIPAHQSHVMTIIPTENIPVNYSLAGVDSSYFNLNQITGEVTFKTEINHNLKKSYFISIMAGNNSNDYTIQNIVLNLSNINKPHCTYSNFISKTSDTLDTSQISMFTLNKLQNPLFIPRDPIHDGITFELELDNQNNCSLNIRTNNSSINIKENYHYSLITKIENKKIFITLNPPTSKDDIEIISHKWNHEITILSELMTFAKLFFFNEIGNKSLIDKNTISKNSFDSLTDILPMNEVGNYKSLSLLTTEDITTTTLDIGSNLFFKITNNINRNFTINEFNIVRYFNNYSETIASIEDKVLLNNGFLNSGESVSLGYTLTSSEEANYWVGTYVLTDIETNESFTNSFVWNGTVY